MCAITCAAIAACCRLNRTPEIYAMLLQAGHTPLHEAANKGHVEVVKILLEAGATVDAKTKVLRLDSPCISQLLTTPVDL